MLQKTARVPFNRDTVDKCQCYSCPVQGASQCAIAREMELKETKEKEIVHKNDIPGAYCATGQPSCTDLDTARPCQCPGCSIFAKYELSEGKPVMYYCRDGKAR
jgi:hypothetical protein